MVVKNSNKYTLIMYIIDATNYRFVMKNYAVWGGGGVPQKLSVYRKFLENYSTILKKYVIWGGVE